MGTLEIRIKELIQFYVKTNYEAYLTQHKLERIEDNNIKSVVTQLYTERREHLKVFVKQSLKQMLGDEYPGDLVILNVLLNVFEDDEYCVNRLVLEIRDYQNKTTSSG
jgi:hypothetical protein|tara:strand:- start:583 stop:906 length:324 start_codon:yes stop_codon:yes gene_type:complete